jgi:hypothetical protein
MIACWCTRASVGTQEGRIRFQEKELTDSSRVLEILFRVIRGERMHSNSLNKLDSGFSENSMLPASLQIPTVLAVSSIVDIAFDFAKQAMGSSGEKEVHRQIVGVIEKLPSTQVHRALDAMFREYRV